MSDNQQSGVQLPNVLADLGRRGFLQGIMAMAAGVSLAACAAPPAPQGAASAQSGNYPFGKPLKAAFSNAGLGATWCAQGKETAEAWGKWFGIEVTWFDGGLSIDKQRKAIDDMATKTWDFVAIQAFGIDTLVDPVKQMIGKGIP